MRGRVDQSYRNGRVHVPFILFGQQIVRVSSIQFGNCFFQKTRRQFSGLILPEAIDFDSLKC